MVMPALLLQKPSSKSKAKEHKEALERRLTLWEKGDHLQLLKRVNISKGGLRKSPEQKYLCHIKEVFQPYEDMKD